MTYKQANVSKKCKEAYKKRKTSPRKKSPRRRRTSPRKKGSRRRMNNNDDDSFKTYKRAAIGYEERSQFVTFEDLTDFDRPTHTVISRHDTVGEAAEKAENLNRINNSNSYTTQIYKSDTPLGSVIVDHYVDL